jgi:hypothetical protein
LNKQRLTGPLASLPQSTSPNSGTILSVKCRLFDLFAGLSLLLCVVASGFWVRSHWRVDWGEWNQHHHTVLAISGSGNLLVETADYDSIPGLPIFSTDADEAMARLLSLGWGDPGPEWDHDLRIIGVVGGAQYCMITIHDSAIVGLFAILPAIWVIRTSVRRRFIHGKTTCKICGYDLVATPDRCPECGNVPKPTKEINRDRCD